MLKFRQWLKEAPNTIDMPQDQGMLDDDQPKPAGKYDHEEVIGGDNTYTIHARSWKSENEEKHPMHHFIAVHDFIAKNTKKHSDSEMSGPEFYHHILHSGEVKGIQSDHEQTEGGKSIWHRLVHDHNYNDIEVTHHEFGSEKKIPLHTGKDWDKNFDHGESSATVFRARLKKGKK
jgi:hypothetical protein